MAARLTEKQIQGAVVELTRQLGAPPTFKDIADYFGLRSASHALYYVAKAEAADLIRVDNKRQPYLIEAI